MKWGKKLLYTCLIVLFIAGVSMMIPAKSDPETTLSMDAPTEPTGLNPGDTFTVDWTITDVTDLFTWGISMEWDPAILNCTGIEEGPFLQDVGTTLWMDGAIDNVIGEMTTPYGCSLLTGSASGSGILATVTFNATALGTSYLDFLEVSLLDPLAAEIPRDVVDGQVVIPEFPAAMIMPILMIATLTAVILGKKAWKKKLRSPSHPA